MFSVQALQSLDYCGTVDLDSDCLGLRLCATISQVCVCGQATLLPLISVSTGIKWYNSSTF